ERPGAPRDPDPRASWLRRHTVRSPILTPSSEIVVGDTGRSDRAGREGNPERDATTGADGDPRSASERKRPRSPGSRMEFSKYNQIYTTSTAAGSKVRQSASERGHRDVTRRRDERARGAGNTQRSRTPSQPDASRAPSRTGGRELRAG